MKMKMMGIRTRTRMRMRTIMDKYLPLLMFFP